MPEEIEKAGGEHAKPEDSHADKPEGIRARDAAMQIPSVVATALLKRPVVLHGITLGAFGADTLLILSTIGNPLGGNSALNLRKLSGTIDDRCIMQAIFALAQPDSAIELAAPPEGDGLTEYDKAALRFVRAQGITPAQMADLSAILARLYVEGLSAAPGAGTENPREAAA